MLDLAEIFELVINRLDNRTFAQETLVQQRHEGVFHVLAAFGNQLQATLKERLEERLRDISSVAKQLPDQVFSRMALT